MRVPRYILGILLLLLMGCESAAPGKALPAFYHWKASWAPSSQALALLDSLQPQRLYLRVFDIDWDEAAQAPVPLAELPSLEAPSAVAEWVPTVFITNRSLQRLPVQAVPALAERLSNKLLSSIERLGLHPVPEVQLDCDWTESTQTLYFALLRECRQRLSDHGIALSATIRLHQLRYPERTGVPPVDRGLLMYYNMGEVQQWEEPNSILNLETAAPYITGSATYPLPLDLGLPLFQWGVLFRDGQMIRLLHGLGAADLSDRARFFPIGEGRYEVVRGTFLQGHYLYETDRIRLEQVRPEALTAAVAQLQALDWPSEFYLSFYHLDSLAAANFDAAFLQSLLLF